MININRLICNIGNTLLEVLETINENGRGIAFVVEPGNRLHGILTDGDIRRLLLNGHQLHEHIQPLVNKEFVYARTTDSYRDIVAKTSDSVKILPIVDDDFQVVDFFEFSPSLFVPAAYPMLNGSEFKYLVDAFMSSWISSTGYYIDRFEKDFSQYCGCPHGVATSNGTTAIHLALEALGIGPGDEVIVPSLTFAATVNAVLHANATPVIVDIEKKSWCIDPKEIETHITPKTKAVIPVHVYGQPCDMEAVMDIARRKNIYVVEDCAEAHGAEVNGQKVGSFGHINCFSFFANKIITTGEGGMCLTHSPELDERMRVLRDHGMSKSKKYWHEAVGYNYRMTNLQAAVGVAQVERITEVLGSRDSVENQYRSALGTLPHVRFQQRGLRGRKKVTWFVCILVEPGQRDLFITKLKEARIDARPFFYPLHQMAIYKQYRGTAPNAEDISRRGIMLPASPLVVNPEVIQTIKQVLKQDNKS